MDFLSGLFPLFHSFLSFYSVVVYAREFSYDIQMAECSSHKNSTEQEKWINLRTIYENYTVGPG